MNRRSFLKGLGTFLILPGAGRIWKATRPEMVPFPEAWHKMSLDITYTPGQPRILRVCSKEYLDLIHKIITDRVGIPNEMEIITTPERAGVLREFFGTPTTSTHEHHTT